MNYKIEYILHSKREDLLHSRYYRALDLITAKEMFLATCENGSLTGEDVELKTIYEKQKNNWTPVES
jgi:hypothetical protein